MGGSTARRDSGDTWLRRNGSCPRNSHFKMWSPKEIEQICQLQVDQGKVLFTVKSLYNLISLPAGKVDWRRKAVSEVFRWGISLSAATRRIKSGIPRKTAAKPKDYFAKSRRDHGKIWDLNSRLKSIQREHSLHYDFHSAKEAGADPDYEFIREYMVNCHCLAYEAMEMVKQAQGFLPPEFLRGFESQVDLPPGPAPAKTPDVTNPSTQTF
jgi:hypothetical protein